MAMPADYGLLLLRIGLGIPLISRGWPLFKKGKGFGRLFGLLEWLIGLLVILGIYAKPVLIAAFAVLIGLIVNKIRLKIGFASAAQKSGWDSDFVLLMIAIALYILGSGTVVVGW